MAELKRKQAVTIVDACRITDGDGFKLKHHDADEAASGMIRPADAPELLANGVARLSDLQEKLYAQGRWSVLCVFQAMDAAGKDGTIKHVMSGVNPQGVQVTSFKAPGSEELSHDFLWRITRALPQRGRIGIFNRSHYEEVLVARVHPTVLENQRLPSEVIGRKFWQHRLTDIAHFERYLANQGIVILKFFLNISRDEQKRRFLARLDEPDKHWKFSASDLQERKYWDDYQHAYEAAIAATAAPYAPWFVVPANQKWFARLVVVEALILALERLDLKPPPLSPEQEAALAEARVALEGEP
ncbi:MAG TPA: polyphosphate kinase 2 family protein [Acetobacteraceae bacterium]|nr:polyphosphate kinase 2 family protein [Acetobacteraceae bacterium]